MLLFACHFSNETAQLIQLGRWAKHECVRSQPLVQAHEARGLIMYSSVCRALLDPASSSPLPIFLQVVQEEKRCLMSTCTRHV